MPVNDDLFKQALTAVGTQEEEKEEDADALAGDLTQALGDPTSDQKAQGQFTPEEAESLKKMVTPGAGASSAQPMWAPYELRQFRRLGMSPERLSFFQTLAGLRKGMGLESELLDKALRGRVEEFQDVEDMPLGQFA